MKKSDYLDTEHLHHRLEFKVGKTKYSVVESDNKYNLLNPTSPYYVGAVFTRTRLSGHFFEENLMSAQYDKEDTLAIGARLTTEAFSTSWDATIWFFVPFSKVKLNTPISVPPKDVYFFKGDEKPSTRVTISSFLLSFNSIIVSGTPSESLFEGTFMMSGVDKSGIAFKSEDGYFDVLNYTVYYNPMEQIEVYEDNNKN